MSVLINNLDEDMINAVSEIPYVHNLNILDRGRIEFGIDRFENNSVNSVLNVLINKGAIISSVYTQEPSLEDVFIKTTSKVQSSPRA